MIITIDGPSASGKSTLALKLAKHLNFMYVNSGYLYRGLAYVLKTDYGYNQDKMNNPDPVDIKAIFVSKNFEYVYQNGLVRVLWVNDITGYLKDIIIGRYAALLGGHDIVRQEIHRYERYLIQDHDTVIEGRACGSVLYPNAEVKFYLTADLSVRAQRLQKDQIKRGNLMIKQQAIDQIVARDTVDQQREVEPLIRPIDAIDLDSTDQNPDELLQQALECVHKALKN